MEPMMVFDSEFYYSDDFAHDIMEEYGMGEVNHQVWDIISDIYCSDFETVRMLNHIPVDNPIIITVEDHLWSGTVTWCRLVETDREEEYYIDDCFTGIYEHSESHSWWVQDGELFSRECHHDGWCTAWYRELRDDISDNMRDMLMRLLEDCCAPPFLVYRFTRPLGDRVTGL